MKKFIGTLFIIIGLGIFISPNIKTIKLDHDTNTYIKNFNQRKNKEKDIIYQKALTYNQKIYKENQKEFKDALSYTKAALSGNFGFKRNNFGYIKIPKMDVKLPLYLGATNENMRKGAVVLGQTSLPIGGKNTNSVIAAHRGYSGIPYFKEIEKLKIGNKIYITNPWETLTYKVESIKIIRPNESDEVKIQKGKDMITLITCHPYRTHGKFRYVVYCIRDKGQQIDNNQIKTTSDSYFKSSTDDIEMEKLVRKICIDIILLYIIFSLLKRIIYKK